MPSSQTPSKANSHESSQTTPSRSLTTRPILIGVSKITSPAPVSILATSNGISLSESPSDKNDGSQS